MKRFYAIATMAAPSALCLALGSCSPLSPQPDPSRFFVLTSQAESDSGDQGRESLQVSLGLGPVTVAPYLDRAPLVTRVSANEVRISEIDRWAEPLPASFARIQAENLKTLLGTEQIVFHPWYRGTSLDYTIEISVLRFERDTSGGAELVASWTIKDGESGRLLVSRDSKYSRTATSNTAEAAVAALSQTAAELSREIASAIQEQHRSQG